MAERGPSAGRYLFERDENMDDRVFDKKSAATWIDSVERSQIRDADIYPWLKAWVHRVSPKEVLDIGCGQGICAEKLDDISRYAGVEPSPLLLDRARQMYGRANREFVLGNVYALPFSDGVFDAAFSIAVWHLLERLDTAAQEMSRILKPDGHFMLVTANPGAYPLWTDSYTHSTCEGRRFQGEVQQNDQVIQDVLYLHTLDEILGSLRAANLEVHKTQTFRESAKFQGQHQFIWIEGQKKRPVD